MVELLIWLPTLFYYAPVYLPKIGYKKDTQIEEGSCYETIEKNILHFSDGTPIILYNNKKDQERL